MVWFLPFCRSGGMADAADSKSAGSNVVWVQVPSPAWREKGSTKWLIPFSWCRRRLEHHVFKVSFDIFDVSVGRFDRKRSTGPFSMSNPISCLCSVGANRGPQDLVRLISCLMRSALMQNSLRSFNFLKAKHEKSGSKATAINLNYVVLSIRLKLSLI